MRKLGSKFAKNRKKKWKKRNLLTVIHHLLGNERDKLFFAGDYALQKVGVFFLLGEGDELVKLWVAGH